MNEKYKNKDLDEAFNVIKSISKAKPLYIKLIKISHPDKYIYSAKQELAKELTILLNENKFNYSALQIIEDRIENELI